MIARQPTMPKAQVSGPPSDPWAPPPMSWKSWSRPETAAPFERYQMKPRMDSRPPSVTMNDGTPM